MTQIQITACKASADAALQCPGMKIVRHLENSMALAFKALKTLVEECRRMEWERGQGVPFQSLKIDDPPLPFKAWSGLVCFHPAFLIDFGYFQGNVPLRVDPGQPRPDSNLPSPPSRLTGIRLASFRGMPLPD